MRTGATGTRSGILRIGSVFRIGLACRSCRVFKGARTSPSGFPICPSRGCWTSSARTRARYERASGQRRNGYNCWGFTQKSFREPSVRTNRTYCFGIGKHGRIQRVNTTLGLMHGAWLKELTKWDGLFEESKVHTQWGPLWVSYGKNTFVEVWRMYLSPFTGFYAFIRRRIRKA